MTLPSHSPLKCIQIVEANQLISAPGTSGSSVRIPGGKGIDTVWYNSFNPVLMRIRIQILGPASGIMDLCNL